MRKYGFTRPRLDDESVVGFSVAIFSDTVYHSHAFVPQRLPHKLLIIDHSRELHVKL